MERRTFLETCAATLGIPWLAPARPVRSKPYIEEGRPEYEEALQVMCVGGPLNGQMVMVSTGCRKLLIPVVTEEGIGRVAYTIHENHAYF
jgi:hypothetical protein